jgi:hypothetical protein
LICIVELSWFVVVLPAGPVAGGRDLSGIRRLVAKFGDVVPVVAPTAMRIGRERPAHRLAVAVKVFHRDVPAGVNCVLPSESVVGQLEGLHRFVSGSRLRVSIARMGVFIASALEVARGEKKDFFRVRF